MKKNQILCLLLAMLLVLGLLSGCGAASGTSAAAEPSEVAGSDAMVDDDEDEDDDDEEADEVDSAEASDVEEATGFTGEVIPAEECQADGYDVRYGMYDFETYAELPLTETPETLTYWVMIQPYMMGYNNVTIDDYQYFQEMEARTGVHLDITAVGMFSAIEQFALMVTSGDYTDLIEGALQYYSGGGSAAIEEGLVVDLNEYLDDMPNYDAWLSSNSSYRAQIQTIEGELPSAALISATERNVGLQLRGDWLDALNLDLPVTYDEYHDVLAAFRDNYGGVLWLDCNGTHRFNCLSAGYDVVVNQGMNDKPLRVVDGTVEFCPMTDDYHDYMQLMNQWWNEGLIYQDFLAQADIPTPDNSAVLNGQIGVWTTDSGTMQTYDSLSDEIDVRPAMQPRKEAGQVLHLFFPNGEIADGTSISTACGNPELAARWLDYNYTYDGHLLANFGVEGQGMTFDADGQPQYSDLVLNNPDMITVATATVYSKYGGAAIIDCNRFSPGYTEKQNAAIELWLTDSDCEHEYPSAVQMTIEESAEYSALMSDLETYASQTALQFITGDLSIETDWDNYVANIQSLYVDDMLEICQTAYDRYIGA